VVSTLHDHLPASTGRTAATPAVQLTQQPPQLPDRFLYMVEGPEAKVAAIDARLVSPPPPPHPPTQAATPRAAPTNPN
jgi:hypothetical protein